MIYIITCIRTNSREYRCSEVKCSGELPLLSGLVRFWLEHNRLDQPIVVCGYVVLVEDYPFYGCVNRKRKKIMMIFKFRNFYLKKLTLKRAYSCVGGSISRDFRLSICLPRVPRHYNTLIRICVTVLGTSKVIV